MQNRDQEKEKKLQKQRLIKLYEKMKKIFHLIGKILDFGKILDRAL